MMLIVERRCLSRRSIVGSQAIKQGRDALLAGCTGYSGSREFANVELDQGADTRVLLAGLL